MLSMVILIVQVKISYSSTYFYSMAQTNALYSFVSWTTPTITDLWDSVCSFHTDASHRIDVSTPT